jgi:serine/threonine protein kinase
MENGVPAGAVAAGILEAGTRVGKYEIRRLIGLGSMSAVYEAARSDTSKPVALKVLSPKRAALPGARARFLTEATLTARVRHPHIVKVIEVGEDGERSYLAMEMLEGEDLARRLRHSTSLSAGETADILGPVCEAVAAAHDSGIVHRDLKPANIFLAILEQKLHPIVLDFGIANGSGDDPGAVPDPHLVFGTPYYLSPEQVADHRAASPASDQWALGVILYECLTGARPYDGDRLDDVFTAIRAGQAVAPTERRSGIPAELGQLVMRAMSLDPKGRFASVRELGQALRPFRLTAGDARAPRRRPPSSPAIMAEASTQSPFSRTLTPEPDVLDGLWFEPEAAEETAADLTLLPAAVGSQGSWAAAPVADVERLPAFRPETTFASLWTAKGRGGIAAAAGGVLGGLALMLLITHGRSAHRVGSPEPAMATARPVEPAAAAPTMPPVATSPSVSAVKEPAAVPQPVAAPEPTVVKEEPVTAKEPAPTKEPAAPEPVATKEPAPAKEPAATKKPKEPVATRKLTTLKSPVLAKESAALTQASPTQIRSPKTERHEGAPALSAPVRNVPATATGSVARDTGERPRARTSTSTDVRLHNGVPLLD